MANYYDEILCDLAQFYNIYHITDYKPRYIATLLKGLPYNSRLFCKLSGKKYSLDIELTSLILDSINLICYSNTKDAQHHRNKPKSIHELLFADKEAIKKQVQGYEIEDFEKIRSSFFKKGG